MKFVVKDYRENCSQCKKSSYLLYVCNLEEKEICAECLRDKMDVIYREVESVIGEHYE